MLYEMLKNNIVFKDSIPSWEDAVSYSAKPLLDKNFITQDYLNKVLENVQKFGFYFVISPEVAIVHADEGYGVNESGASLLKLKNKVAFGDNKDVKFIFTFASKEDGLYTNILQKFALTLCNKESVNMLKNAETEQDILAVFN